MNILIRKEKGGGAHLLFHLAKRSLRDEFALCLRECDYTRAIAFVREKAVLLEKVREEDLPNIQAAVILSDKRAHYDLTAGGPLTLHPGE
jgi:hypothetical protein